MLFKQLKTFVVVQNCLLTFLLFCILKFKDGWENRSEYPRGITDRHGFAKTGLKNFILLLPSPIQSVGVSLTPHTHSDIIALLVVPSNRLISELLAGYVKNRRADSKKAQNLDDGIFHRCLTET